jgi:thiamine pyrophosphate-dependent acetolactate synthase large subunit-like protein
MLPSLDVVAIARGYGRKAYRAETLEAMQRHFVYAAASDGPTAIEVPIWREKRSLSSK